ncbi:PREDICTED: uncharacterized protein LOC109586031 [Amphimedon queenslandica]|uniref:Death domain-containing protein n=1 Tax=Amphimedon queenslandica TaxID=400682 RepID=A0AAN0JL65_AMPQE|nr:PREDICTED: uncharacterized protein LOC109586031 [Amphimedon queenslandica]|eukprot:XP_019857757.1 PREDICTED: uncharacterized protein LOC109586031 [Amphimedon queenslandica]
MGVVMRMGSKCIFLGVSLQSLRQFKFGQTFLKFGSIIKSNPQSPSLYSIKYVLSHAYDKTLLPQLAQHYDISDILQLVRDHSSLDDIRMLKFLVNEFNIEEAKPVIKEYKEAVEELKMKVGQFLEEELSKASSIIKHVTIVVDKDTEESVIKDVQRLSLAILPYHIELNVIRSDDSMWEDNKPESYTNTYVGPTVQSKDTTLTTEVPAGTTEKDEDQVMLLQEKVESIQKQLEEEKELYEEKEQFYEQAMKKYEEEILQQKRKHIQNEERIATLTEQQEEVTGDLKHKTEQYEELISDNELTHKQLEELEKELKEEKIEKEELQIKIDDLQQELEQVSVQNEYTITQSKLQSEIQKVKNESETFQKQRKALILENERLMALLKDHNVPVEQKEETEILQETETVHTSLNKEIQFNYLVPSQDNLEGLSESQIAGKKLFLVQGDKPQLMNWEEYGLRISVPEDSLSASETVSVLALVGGHFKGDGDSGDEGKGEREGQGAGGQEGEAGGVGRSDREEEGNGLKEPVDCTEDSELSTSQSKTIVSTHSTGIPEATVYAGQVFYQREERRDLMRFTAARDLNVLHQYINKRYSNPEIDEDFTFQFNPSLKYLQLIFDGPQLKPTTGWTVSPHKNPCLIRERDILGLGDNSTKTTIPPSCLVSIYAENSPHTVPNLSYSVPLKGVQEQMEIIIIRPLRTMSSSDSGYSQALNISNLDAILTYLKEGHFPSSSWLDLGLKLGLSYDTTLKNIESNYSKVEDCLRECNS